MSLKVAKIEGVFTESLKYSNKVYFIQEMQKRVFIQNMLIASLNQI